MTTKKAIYDELVGVLQAFNDSCKVAAFLAYKLATEGPLDVAFAVPPAKWAKLARFLSQPTIPDDATRNMMVIGTIGAEAAKAFIEFTWPEKPKPVAKQKYIARLLVVVEADSEAEACDAISAAMSENLQGSGAVVEWSYASTNGTYDHPLPVPVELDADEWAEVDLCNVWYDAQVTAGLPADVRSPKAATPAPEPAETPATDAPCEDVAPSTRAAPPWPAHATYGVPAIVAVSAKSQLDAVYLVGEAMDMTIVSAWNVWTLPGGETLPAKPIAGLGENVSMVDLSAVYRNAE